MAQTSTRQQQFVEDRALHKAAKVGHIGIALTLLKAGAKVNLPEYYGKTVLSVAAENGRLDVLELLLKYDLGNETLHKRCC
jgi:ankyrin repeat protein